MTMMPLDAKYNDKGVQVKSYSLLYINMGYMPSPREMWSNQSYVVYLYYICTRSFRE